MISSPSFRWASIFVMPWISPNMNDTEMSTYIRDEYIKHTLEMADKFVNDPDRENRLVTGRCVKCHYETFMAGQGFTQWKCRICGKEDMHSNTRVPRLCEPCAKTAGLCWQCGATIEWSKK